MIDFQSVLHDMSEIVLVPPLKGKNPRIIGKNLAYLNQWNIIKLLLEWKEPLYVPYLNSPYGNLILT